ncbi:ABC transporter permease [Sporomusa sphaeroides]|jgi:ABC-2 type transport system permease protein|uniref:Transport permease protein n=1 Tax=uncultured Sporomusa sp. TaxID=307249 RepID=A0A212LVX7_9FIRM|nr:ABC transporter permease [Sporomusa sphaeroides]SCM81579.1 ABC-type polysaccharide/polyol phosphate export system, permease component [uncultured Sporomusa sp.]HML31777.1 ABC transporter permease [Sporomusa sphaeroides]
MLTDIATVFWRDWIVLQRRLGTFIFSRMITPVLYLVAFGWGVGRSVQVSQGNYLDFIVPGILALNSMNISFNSVASPLNMSRLYHKTLEEYLVAPISSLAFILGKVLSGTLRGIISSLIIIVLAYLFGAKFQLNLLFWLVILLNCLVFSALGFVAAMLINSHEDMGNFSTYVLLPMSFLCATFFRIDKLPAFVQWVLELLPLTHASHALRAIGSGGEPAAVSWLVMLGYIVVLLAISVWTMEKVRE